VSCREVHAVLLIARHTKPVEGLLDKRMDFAEVDIVDYAALENTIRRPSRISARPPAQINAGFEGKNGGREINMLLFSRGPPYMPRGRHLPRAPSNLDNPNSMLAEKLADILRRGWKLSSHICVRDVALTPTKTTS
jgi:hypothetical protein